MPRSMRYWRRSRSDEGQETTRKNSTAETPRPPRNSCVGISRRSRCLSGGVSYFATRPRAAGLHRPGTLCQLAQHVEALFVVGLPVERIHLGKGNLALLVHNKHRALSDARNGVAGAQHAKLLRDFAMREKVATQRVVEQADVSLLPRDVAGNRIHANAHDLGVKAGELFEVRVIRRHLRPSNRRPVQHPKGDDDMLLPLVVAELDAMLLLAGHGGQIEVGRRVSCFECHSFPPKVRQHWMMWDKLLFYTMAPGAWPFFASLARRPLHKNFHNSQRAPTGVAS